MLSLFGASFRRLLSSLMQLVRVGGAPSSSGRAAGDPCDEPHGAAAATATTLVMMMGCGDDGRAAEGARRKKTDGDDRCSNGNDNNGAGRGGAEEEGQGLAGRRRGHRRSHHRLDSGEAAAAPAQASPPSAAATSLAFLGGGGGGNAAAASPPPSSAVPDFEFRPSDAFLVAVGGSTKDFVVANPLDILLQGLGGGGKFSRFACDVLVVEVVERPRQPPCALSSASSAPSCYHPTLWLRYDPSALSARGVSPCRLFADSASEASIDCLYSPLIEHAAAADCGVCGWLIDRKRT